MGGAVAEHDPALLLAVHLAQQHPVLELRRAPRVEADNRAVRRLVLPVADVGGDHDLRVGVEDDDLVGHHGEVAARERHHPRGAELDALAGLGHPQQFAAQHALAEVEGAAERLDLRRREPQLLAVDGDHDGLDVGDVDDGLPDAGEADSVLGVPDVPGLVEAVDEGAVGVRLDRALLVVATQAEVPVADREDGLALAEACGVVAVLRESPVLDGEAAAIDRVSRRCPHGSNSARSLTTRSAPESRRVWAPTPRSTPTTRPNAPALPASVPETASSNTTARSFGTPRATAARR